MAPRSKTTRTPRVKTTPAPESSTQSTKSPGKRPARTRKPTQKAAELAASTDSKLFKSIVTGDIDTKDIHDGDSSLHHREDHPSSEGKGDLPEVTADTEMNPPNSPKKSDSTKHSDDAATTQPPPKVREGCTTSTEATDKAIEAPIIRTKKRKHADEPEDASQASLKRSKPMSTRATRFKSITPAIETIKSIPTSPKVSSPVPSPAAITTSTTKPPEKRKRATINDNPVPENIKIDASHPTESPKKLSSPPPTISTLKSTQPQPSTAPPPSSTPPPVQNPSTTTPRRIKMKPMTPVVDSALEGVTGLPCGLSCLSNEQMFYAMTKFLSEDEDLAEEIARRNYEATDLSDEACLLRCRYNIVMAEFCVCGRCDGVRGGGKTDKERELDNEADSQNLGKRRLRRRKQGV